MKKKGFIWVIILLAIYLLIKFIFYFTGWNFIIFQKIPPIFVSLSYSIVSILALIIIIKISKTSFRELGFTKDKIKRDIIWAIFLFIIILIFMFLYFHLILSLIPERILDWSLVYGFNNIKSVDSPLLWVKILDIFSAFFIISLGEEMKRFFIFCKIEESFGTIWAFFGSAILFAIFHLDVSLGSALSSFAGALLLNYFWILRKRRIAAPIVTHGLWNSFLSIIKF
jgi:membrane protease YdiL (CAAX protease family)